MNRHAERDGYCNSVVITLRVMNRHAERDGYRNSVVITLRVMNRHAPRDGYCKLERVVITLRVTARAR